tara:strand:+ start:271 stop:2469 length:2199 start_codon:yes stop_codon:yes gene_type:complete
MNRYFKIASKGILLLASPFLILYFALVFDFFGEQQNKGKVEEFSNPLTKSISEKSDEKIILFGDLHVHTTYSLDAFLGNLPILEGEGTHPVSDACNFARFCANLDFFSINDHAEYLTRREWTETIESLRNCSDVSSEVDGSGIIPFLGWEWTQTSLDVDKHYGHKNVILKSLEENVPERPIGAPDHKFFKSIVDAPSYALFGAMLYDYENMSDYFNYRQRQLIIRNLKSCDEDVHVKDLPLDCLESAEEPSDLYRKLEEWDTDSLVIPHGSAWGNTSPPMATWENQLDRKNHNPKFQNLIEIFSGHGNTEEFRNWEAFNEVNGKFDCPAPTEDYLPDCFQAGEIIRERCRISAGSEEECNLRAEEARENFTSANPFGLLTIPNLKPEELLDSGQCRDCYLPAFDYRPRSSVQYALALRDFSGNETQSFRFGFIGSSDNHSSRPGVGYKEIDRLRNTDSKYKSSNKLNSLTQSSDDYAIPRSQEINLEQMIDRMKPSQGERIASFLYTGGLIATHVEQKNRDSIWTSLNEREVYATSGERILLWFELINHPSGDLIPMGSETYMQENPRFKVRALGSQKQAQGCSKGSEIDKSYLEKLCNGECFNPVDERNNISRIEIVRIRPQSYPNEPIETLIEDSWMVFECDPSQEGCVVEFEDANFLDANREIIYYVRAIQEPSKAIGAANLACEFDDSGKCKKVNLCGDVNGQGEGDCLFESEERAWSSPIFIRYSQN